MNIRSFKEGDVITRNEPMRYTHNGSADSSYCGDRFELVGFDEESKIIFLKGCLLDSVSLSFARDAWDEGWCKYPESLYKKTEKKNKK
tara:strand:- start:29797 stop:30060 length:264 start_codon:yes stop_codon:yes gene_type:complete